MDENAGVKIGPPLTWNELADIYEKATGKRARIQPMENVSSWAELQTDKFLVDDDGYVHLILGKEGK